MAYITITQDAYSVHVIKQDGIEYTVSFRCEADALRFIAMLQGN